jgi:ferredoxin
MTQSFVEPGPVTHTMSDAHMPPDGHLVSDAHMLSDSHLPPEAHTTPEARGHATAPAIPEQSPAHDERPRRRRARPGSSSVSAAISVDNNRCHLYAVCQDEAPDVFEVATDGRLRYRGRIGADLIPEALQAVRLCPMQAVRLDIR